MNIYLQYILGAIVITFANVYAWSKILNKTIELKKKKNYFLVVALAVTIVLNYFFINQFIRILTLTAFMAIFIKFIFNERIKNCILVSIITQVFFIISEFVFSFILILFKVNSEDFLELYAGTLLSNLGISIILVFIIRFKFSCKFYYFLVKVTDKIKYNIFIMLLLILMISINIFTVTLYYDFNFVYLVIFNTVLMIIVFLIVINSMNNKNKYIKVYDKYNTTLNSLKEYEEILDKYRISNHENKNQLLTIRNMVPKSNKKVLKYIDTIVENELKDNDKIMLETAKIPAGGLRGLIYSKVLLMDNLNINYDFEISKEIRTVDLINKIDDSTMLDICKIIGVYLDNSIQSVQHIKEKYVGISMYLEEGNLVITISNNYENTIDMERIEEKGYTSKGRGHGYGLSLAKELIDKNKKLSNLKSLNNNIFTQILKIKM